VKIRLALDSGAYSLFNKFAAKKVEKKDDQKASLITVTSRKASWEFYESEKFVTYLDSYITYCREHKQKFDFHATIDAIYNAELSWKIYQLLLDKGLSPLPVFHFGEPIKYLKRMCDTTDYIGIGGMAQGVSVSEFLGFGNEIFKYLKGSKIRTHGFAVTQHKSLMIFPWYSVDSTSPLIAAIHGNVMLPTGNNGTGRPTFFSFGTRTHATNHINKLGEVQRTRITTYLEPFGLTLKDLEGNNYHNRCFVNYQTQNFIAEAKGIRYYFSGQLAGKSGSLLTTLTEHNPNSTFNYLGTFFYLQYLRTVEEYIQTNQNIVEYIKKGKPSFFNDRTKDNQNGNSLLNSHPQISKPRTPRPGLRTGTDSPVLHTKPRFRFQR